MTNTAFRSQPITRLTTAARAAISLVFVLLMLTGTAFAGEYASEKNLTYHPLSDIGKYAAQVCTLRQSDKDLRTNTFTYREQSFVSAGCKPASIANALAMVYGVTDHDEAVALLHDTLIAFSSGAYRITGCDLSYLDVLDTTAGSAAISGLASCKTLNRLIADHGGEIMVFNHSLTVEEAMTELLAAPHGTLICRRTLADDWSWLPNLTAALEAAGLGDARIALMQLSVGVDVTPGPFSATVDGHFVSFYLQASEWNASGTLYMLDSLARAASYSELYSNVALQAYPYVTKANTLTFAKLYDVRRISSNTLQLALKYPLQQQLKALAPDQAIAYLTEALASTNLYGHGALLIQLP